MDTTQSTQNTEATAQSISLPEEVFSSRDMDASYEEEDCIPVVLEGNTISCDSAAVEVSGSTATIRKGGVYLISGSLENGSLIVDVEKTEKVQLVLKNASIHCETFASIYVRQADKVFVTLTESSENSLSGGESFVSDGDVNVDGVLFSREDLTLNGSGKLTVSSPGGHGIVSKDSLRLTGGSYVIDAAGHGLSGKDEVSIAGGTFEISAGKDGIQSENEEDSESGLVYLAGGTLRITSEGDGISASGTCMILDGEYTVTAGGGSENAAQHSSGQNFFGGQRGGSKPAGGTSAPDKGEQRENPQGPRDMGGMDGSGLGRRGDTFSQSGDTPGVVISGGTVKITASGDGIDSNGSLEITGGMVTVCGPIQGDTSVLDYNSSGVISGGTFLGTGASAMAQTFSGGGQGVISVNAGNQSAGTKITLSDSAGKLLLSLTPELGFAVVILSAPELRKGESYVLDIGGNSGTYIAK